jgi:hypothetical protein
LHSPECRKARRLAVKEWRVDDEDLDKARPGRPVRDLPITIYRLL